MDAASLVCFVSATRAGDLSNNRTRALTMCQAGNVTV